MSKEGCIVAPSLNKHKPRKGKVGKVVCVCFWWLVLPVLSLITVWRSWFMKDFMRGMELWDTLSDGINQAESVIMEWAASLVQAATSKIIRCRLLSACFSVGWGGIPQMGSNIMTNFAWRLTTLWQRTVSLMIPYDWRLFSFLLLKMFTHPFFKM